MRDAWPELLRGAGPKVRNGGLRWPESHCPGELGDKEREARKKQPRGDPYAALYVERTERQAPCQGGQDRQRHRSEAQAGELYGAPPVHDAIELSTIRLSFRCILHPSDRQEVRHKK